MTEILHDVGKQRVVDGRVQTLAKCSIALWVETDDVREAQGTLAKKLESVLGPIEYTDDVLITGSD